MSDERQLLIKMITPTDEGPARVHLRDKNTLRHLPAKNIAGVAAKTRKTDFSTSIDILAKENIEPVIVINEKEIGIA